MLICVESWSVSKVLSGAKYNDFTRGTGHRPCVARCFSGPGRRLPSVAMTANTMAGDYATCFESGMDDSVTSPPTS